jgi:hypothetical protein
VRHISGSNRGDFEIILYEGSNDILFQYANTNLDPYANGLSATIGLNKGDGVDDSLYSFNSEYLANGRAVRFKPTTTFGLTALTPPDGAVGVSRNPTLWAFFNKPLLVSSIATPATTFRLAETASNTVVPSFTSAVGAGNAVAVNFPSGTLNATTSYTATISTALTDIYGIHLQTPVTWAFTTGP